MISVTIATYNGEKYIHQQLLSIYNQSHPVDEVIISDDVSTDKTVAIAEAFIKERKLYNWHVVVNKVNLGFSSNFLSAVRRTTGNIIFLCDQDDLWEADKVEIMSSIMHSDNDICSLSSKYSIINGVGEKIDGRILGFNDEKNSGDLEEISVDYMIGSSVVRGCTMCISKKVREVVVSLEDIDLKYSLGHDWYLNMLASIIGKNYSLNRSLLRYRIHDSNISLGGLRKKKLLSATNDFRNRNFEQVITAHRYLLSNKYLSSRLSNQEKKKISRMIQFFEKRLKLTTTRSLFSFIMLLFNINMYYQCVKQIKLAFRMYFSDLFYAYNINWHLKSRSND